MLSSKSRCSTKSPIGTVPYDVLLEIFVHCLPRDRLELRQPETWIAPMLLCHVCSSWRTVALAARTLWTHLSYYLTARDVDDDRNLKILEDKIEFIQWWKKNQGSLAPFLRLHIGIRDDDSGVSLTRLGDTMTSVMNYVTTAQYLEIGPISWHEVKAMSGRGDNANYPNLHTLVTDQWSAPINDYFHRTCSAIRRLAILDESMCLLHTTSIPAQWSTLTHLSITTDHMPFDFWVTLTMTVPCLQWAYIAFQGLFIDEYTTMERTLPQLSTLFIECSGYEKFSPLLKDLHLPALTSLFLASISTEWFDREGMTDIYTVLESAPAVRNLTLRKLDFLYHTEIDYADSDIEPIWSLVPHLVHLRLELYITTNGSKIEVEQALDKFARRGFFSSDNRWLDLYNSACPIEMITVIDHGSEFFTPSHSYEPDRELKASIIRKCATNASNIPLHIISQPFNDFGKSWKEWSSGN
ncbi:hypothetical protein BJ912DRAFT_980767 [Pholiota molesta]|nr:hypothetical protein BJ912DRAFT_980767 [Pholiota molesta]